MFTQASRRRVYQGVSRGEQGLFDGLLHHRSPPDASSPGVRASSSAEGTPPALRHEPLPAHGAPRGRPGENLGRRAGGHRERFLNPAASSGTWPPFQKTLAALWISPQSHPYPMRDAAARASGVLKWGRCRRPPHAVAPTDYPASAPAQATKRCRLRLLPGAEVFRFRPRRVCAYLDRKSARSEKVLSSLKR